MNPARGDRVLVVDAAGRWHRGVATSDVEGRYVRGRRRHDFTGIYVRIDGREAAVFWPIESVGYETAEAGR